MKKAYKENVMNIVSCLAGLATFFKDDSGEYSCMRLLSFIVVVFVLGLWAWGNVAAGQYVPLGLGESGIITAAVGSKAAQGYFEYGGGKI